MAETWGDIISRNYSAGRAIADDFVSARYAKKADELRSQYEAKAEAEGKKLQDYMPDLEKELRALATGVGATRRGVTDRHGQALDMGTMARIRQDVVRGGDQRAGALAMAGKQAEARQERAGALYSTGENFDDAQGQQIAGRTIEATSSAKRPDGTYDMKQGALNQAGVAADFGNGNAAVEQTEQAETFRMKSAAAKATQLYNLIANPESADPDQVRGLWLGLKEDVPEFKNVDIQLKDGKVYIYEGGKVTGDLDPQEAAQLLQTAIQAPGQAIASSMQAQLKAAEDAKTQKTGVDNKILDASIKVVENLKAAGIPDTVTSAALAAQKAAASTTGGWQLQDIGEEPGTFLMQKGGQVYTIKTNVAPNLETGEPGGMLQVFDAEGNPVPGDVLNKQDAATMQQALMDLSLEKAKAGTRLNFEVVGQQLRILNELGAAYGGSQVSGVGSRKGKGSRAERNNNPGNIEDGAFAKSLPGYKGGDGRFAVFDTPESGAAAQTKLLESYVSRGFNTVDKIIGRWSPQNDPTNAAGSTSNYAQYVAKKLGVDPGQPLTAEQLPALAQAMAEFESGNTGGALDTKTAATATPAATAADPKAPVADRAAAVVDSAPAPQTRVPGRKAAITPGGLGKQASDLRALVAQYREQKQELENFDKDQGTEMVYAPGPINASVGGMRPRNLSSAQLRVRDQLAAQLAETERAMVEANRDTKASTRALNASEAARKNDEEALALAAQYGGAADFFNRADKGGSR